MPAMDMVSLSEGSPLSQYRGPHISGHPRKGTPMLGTAHLLFRRKRLSLELGSGEPAVAEHIQRHRSENVRVLTQQGALSLHDSRHFAAMPDALRPPPHPHAFARVKLFCRLGHSPTTACRGVWLPVFVPSSWHL